jgi:hypothetical protein
MSGGAMVWLTDNELKLLDDWHWLAENFDRATLTSEDDALLDKLKAVREEVACRTPGNGR